MQSFIEGGYQFENKNIYNVLALMSQEEIKEFACDCRAIKWADYIRNYMIGMSIWALKEDHLEPIHNFDQILLKNKSFGDNTKLTLLKKLYNFKEKNSQRYENSILKETRFHEFFL